MDDTTGRVTAGSDDETKLRTQEIREEIAQTRVEMAETIEAIQRAADAVPPRRAGG